MAIAIETSQVTSDTTSKAKMATRQTLPSPGPVALLPISDVAIAENGLELIKSELQHVKGAQAQLGHEEVNEYTRGILWLDSSPKNITLLESLLSKYSNIEWIQLPMAGINAYIKLVSRFPNKIWTSSKGAYAQPVAEHALTLALGLLRYLPMHIHATSWGPSQGNSLFHKNIVILGAGGITVSLLSLLEPFSPTITIVRRKAEPLEDSAVPPRLKERIHYATLNDLDNVLPDADVVFTACALTSDTRACLGKSQFDVMQKHALIINVARGEVVKTDDLVEALREGKIGGAALDVTDPEPLPCDHPLWNLETDHRDIPRNAQGVRRANVIITPHTANELQQSIPLYARRIRHNVEVLVSQNGRLEGIVDLASGY